MQLTLAGLTAGFRDTAYGPFVTVTGEGLSAPVEYALGDHRRDEDTLRAAIDYTHDRLCAPAGPALRDILFGREAARA